VRKASEPSGADILTEERRCVFYLKSRHHGSNCQLKALAEELILGDSRAVACDTDVRSRKRLFRPLFKFGLVVAGGLRAIPALQRAVIRLALKGDVPSPKKGDIIVAKTAPFEIPLALLGVQQGVVTCFIGQPKRVARSYIDRVIAIPSSPARKPDCTLSVLPSSVKYADFCRVKEGFPPQSRRDRVWSLLVGGNANGFEYSKKHWELLGQLLVEVARVFSIKWLVSTSPRSGAVAEEFFQRVFEETQVVQSLVIWSDPVSRGQLSILQMAASSEVVMVTEDSAGMLSDMAITRLPIVGLRPAEESYNLLSTPVAENLQAGNCLYRSVLGEFDPEAFHSWLEKEFRPLSKCWTEELRSLSF